MDKTKNIFYGSLIALAGLTASPQYGVAKNISQDSNPSNLEKTLTSEPGKKDKVIKMGFCIDWEDANGNNKAEESEFTDYRGREAVFYENESISYVLRAPQGVKFSTIKKDGIKIANVNIAKSKNKAVKFDFPNEGPGEYSVLS